MASQNWEQIKYSEPRKPCQTKNPPYPAGILLLLSFFESNVLAERFAVLFEFDFSFDALAILASDINLASFLVFEMYEVDL